MLSRSYLIKKKVHQLHISRIPYNHSNYLRIQSYQSTKLPYDSASSPINQPPRKSYIPTEHRDLQLITTQSLIHEISMQQMDATAKVVPWFLEQMPVSYISIDNIFI